MIKAKNIRIDNYRSNIEVFADFGEKYQNMNGRVYHRIVDSDSIPSPSYIGTIREIQADCSMEENGGWGITLAQAKEIKSHIRRYCMEF